MKNTHFAPALHGSRRRGSRHSEKICIFFSKMKKKITPNVITFCSDFPYKKVYEIVGYFKRKKLLQFTYPNSIKILFLNKNLQIISLCSKKISAE